MEYAVRICKKSAPWLSRGLISRASEQVDAPADILRDFYTEGNIFSVYYCNGTEIAAKEIAVVIAAGRQKIEPTSCIVFAAQLLAKCGEVTKTTGTTKFSNVNGLHHNVEKLSAMTVGWLATAIWLDHDTRWIPVTAPEVERLTVDAIKSGALSLTELAPGVQKSIEPLLLR